MLSTRNTDRDWLLKREEDKVGGGRCGGFALGLVRGVYGAQTFV